jgi:hypothetical protein
VSKGRTSPIRNEPSIARPSEAVHAGNAVPATRAEFFRQEADMPLKTGRGRETISSNIKTLVHEYEKDGSIGTTHPASRKKAVKQAVAISLRKAGVSRSQKNRSAK